MNFFYIYVGSNGENHVFIDLLISKQNHKNVVYETKRFCHFRVFPKWISLNSGNSVNHDKIQKWYGYQRYYPSCNRYITSTSNIKCIFITTSG